jgi:ferrous iron transport protein B
MTRIALVGQPNSGKSTIFNHLVGYRAHTSNFPGTTVEYLESQAYIDGLRTDLVDLPGVYSLTSFDEAEAETRDYLLHQPVDVILNVVDASLLSRSLELTLQLLEFGLPLVLCLNMEDEARRKGIEIDLAALSELLGVSVVSAVAVRGEGVKAAASACARAARARQAPPAPRYSPDVEAALCQLEAEIAHRPGAADHHSLRLTAVKLIEGDPHFASSVLEDPALLSRAEALSSEFAARRGRTPDGVLASERHARAMEIFEAVSTIGRPTTGLRDRIDAVLMHRTFGLVALGAILYGLFLFVFRVGSLVEGPLIGLFDRSIELLGTVLPEGGFAFAAVSGVIQGVGGALGIVLPYLVPFLIGLAVLEDIGYLPRAGYLADGLMHRIGLHGKSIIPFVLGYGCSVPAVMATRILESKRDRFITAMLATMIPCVARTTIVFGLIGYFLGPNWAFALYVINLVVIAAVGKVLTVLAPGVSPGMILEIPSYKIPSHRVVASKVWLQVVHFLRVAAPILIAGSVLLEILQVAGVTDVLNLVVSPITWSLGLPLSLGVTLIFGIFRKELSLVMLFQALGTTHVLSVLTPGQMMTFTLFVLFYVPCVATVAVLRRELGWRQTALVVAGTTSTALAIALLARGIASAF